jgi:MFS transporter, DHA1 family, multidrug resistance protein
MSAEDGPHAKPRVVAKPRLVAKPGIAVLVAISALQPFALNTLAPATPAVARALSASYSAIQLTLSVYLITVAVAQLIIGPLSDRFGRRPCVLASILAFITGAVLAFFANDLPTLLMARAMQGAGAGTAFALARAIIRDTATRDETASQIGYVTMVMVTVPMVSPLIGAWLESHLGWRSIFAAMLAFGLVSLGLTLWRLTETAPNTGSGGSILSTFRALPLLAQDRAFLASSLALSATSGAFFAFIAAAPFLVVETMGQSTKVYGLWFVLNAIGYMIGNFCTGRLSQRLGSQRLAKTGLAISFCALSLAVALSFTPFWSLAAFFCPLMVSALGNGLTIPSATAGGLSVRPDLAGSAAGLLGAIQLGFGAIAAIALGWLVTIWPPSLTLAMWLFTGIALYGTPHISSIRNN